MPPARFRKGILHSINKHRGLPPLAHRALERHNFGQLGLHALANTASEEPNFFVRVLSFDRDINMETGGAPTFSGTN